MLTIKYYKKGSGWQTKQGTTLQEPDKTGIVDIKLFYPEGDSEKTGKLLYRVQRKGGAWDETLEAELDSEIKLSAPDDTLSPAIGIKAWFSEEKGYAVKYRVYGVQSGWKKWAADGQECKVAADVMTAVDLDVVENPSSLQEEEKALSFDEQKKLMNRLHKISDISEYLDALARLKKCYVAIVVNESMGGLKLVLRRKLAKLGVREISIDKAGEELKNRFYIAFLHDGEAIHEKLADSNSDEDKLVHETEAFGQTIRFTSRKNERDFVADVIIDTVNYAVNSKGLNFVVFDENGTWINSSTFDVPGKKFKSREKGFYVTDWNTSEILKLDKVADRKQAVYDMLTSKSIVLVGGGGLAQDFIDDFSGILKIDKVLSDNDAETKIYIDGKETRIPPYCADEIGEDQYIIVCRDEGVAYDVEDYKKTRARLSADDFVFGKDFTTVKLARAILEKKQIMIMMGFCQHHVMACVLLEEPEVTKKTSIFLYRMNTEITRYEYRYPDIAMNMRLADLFLYVPHFLREKGSGEHFMKYLASDAVTIRAPRLSFRGLHPYKDQNLTIVNELFRTKTTWGVMPFTYAEKAYDELIIQGKSNKEIYDELMDENFIPEADIKKNLKLALKLVQIVDAQSDIKIYDYIAENYQKHAIFTDCLHYTHDLYIELLKRLVEKYDLCDPALIVPAVERFIKSGKGIRHRGFMDMTEVPILPCVVKALGIEYATDDYQYFVRYGQDDKVGTLNRKEMIYLYCDCVRSALLLKKHQVVKPRGTQRELDAIERMVSGDSGSEYDDKIKEIEDYYKNSNSYKIGRIITAIPRSIKGMKKARKAKEKATSM